MAETKATTKHTLPNGLVFLYDNKMLPSEKVVLIAADLLEFERVRLSLNRKPQLSVHAVVAQKHGTTTRTCKRIKRRLKDAGAWPDTPWKK